MAERGEKRRSLTTTGLVRVSGDNVPKPLPLPLPLPPSLLPPPACLESSHGIPDQSTITRIDNSFVSYFPIANVLT